jgi:hypothetical protein
MLEVERPRRHGRHARAFGNDERSTERVAQRIDCRSRFRVSRGSNVRERGTIGERGSCRFIITNCRKFSCRSDMRIENESVPAPKMDEGSHANGFVVGRHAVARRRPRQDRNDGTGRLHEVGIDRERWRNCCARGEQRRGESVVSRMSRRVQNEIQNRNANAFCELRMHASIG